MTFQSVLVFLVGVFLSQSAFAVKIDIQCEDEISAVLFPIPNGGGHLLFTGYLRLPLGTQMTQATIAPASRPDLPGDAVFSGYDFNSNQFSFEIPQTALQAESVFTARVSHFVGAQKTRESLVTKCVGILRE